MLFIAKFVPVYKYHISPAFVDVHVYPLCIPLTSTYLTIYIRIYI